MIPELGQISLILALILAILLGTLPLIGAWRGNERLVRMAPSLAVGHFVFVTAAYLALSLAFFHHDFSVRYVATNSNLLLPWYYRLSAVWGGHEGSLLLWMLMLAGWTVAVAFFSRALPREWLARVLAVMGLVSVGFLLFTLLTSNPFERILPGAADGQDLNPLLQDPGMIFHPPLLYMGYVGFAVAFAFAIAGLLAGGVQKEWVRWSRPWTLAAWAFLTGGITLGSWWAYYELGWGGWWFWDPVENASFMPWLVGTALIHSQAVTEKRGSFPAWTILLSIAAFSLSLLGTFLVRSGVLTSVHAFANDPERGLFILGFMAAVTGGSLLLYALRAPRIATGPGFDWLSRETMLLLNNVFFTVAAAMVLLGTLYPLIIDFMGWGQISVGPPYFGSMFILLMTPVIALMPFGPFTRWKKDRAVQVAAPLLAALAASIVLGLVITASLGAWNLRAATGWIGGLWVIFGALSYLRRHIVGGSSRADGRDARRLQARASLPPAKPPPPSRLRWKPLLQLPRHIIGMTLAHLGVGVFIIGVGMVGSSELRRDVRLAPGDSVEVAGYNFRFEEMAAVTGPNWTADEGRLTVFRGEREITRMRPQKRRYLRGGQVMTQVALQPGFTRDLYVALGEPFDDGRSWSLRIHIMPFVRWIWGGAVIILLGGIISATDRRYRATAVGARGASHSKAPVGGPSRADLGARP